MMKSFNLTVALATASILFVPATAFSRPITATSKSSVVPNSDTDKPVCYMQTTDGRTLNLTSFCGKKPKTHNQQVVITDIRYEDDFMIGRVVNHSNKTVTNARVNYEVLGQDGSLIEKGAIAIDPPILSPGQSATFETFMEIGTKVRTTSVAWD